MNRRLDFLTAEFQPGVNLTVRNGSKWADARPGGLLDVYRTGGAQPLFTAEVTEVIVTFREGITNSDLVNEHASSCKTVAGLNAAMEAAYGPNWGPEVVLLSFQAVDLVA
jgi:hypothetical protein